VRPSGDRQATGGVHRRVRERRCAPETPIISFCVPVPDFQTLMRPILVALDDGAPRSPKAVRAVLATEFDLTAEDLAEKIPSGRAKTFQNRVGWALTYMLRAGLISRPKRSTYQLTDRGREVLKEHPKSVGIAVLKQFEEFRDFHQDSKTPSQTQGPSHAPRTTDLSTPQTPQEQIETAYTDLEAALVADILDRVMEKDPEFFEQLVLDVLKGMGYGGRVGRPSNHLGQTGDEGVDGVIQEDELGLDLIYVQAKRWAAPVGRPEIQKFFGALHGKHANKGVFITTSSFSSEAVAYAASVTPRIVLVDGHALAQLMIDYDVGTTETDRYVLKRLDLDYFAADEDEGGPPTSDPSVPVQP
jgi:restriction system protein